jgi:hypothetical protein
MEFIVWVETRLAGKTLEIHEVAKVDRVATGIGPGELGLTLAHYPWTKNGGQVKT